MSLRICEMQLLIYSDRANNSFIKKVERGLGVGVGCINWGHEEVRLINFNMNVSFKWIV